ncbi:MAG: nucleotide sugar dehydrogenase [Peptoniphilus sp.]|nr:nucleotide sugar dehydrogenase [Peptoniphilus sp.]
MSERKDICVIGTGYIGLPTAAMFSSKGFNVKAYDKSEKVRDTLRTGNFFVEKGINELLEEAKKSGHLSVVDDIVPADVFIICVPTPITDKKTANMSMVEEVTRKISEVIKSGDIVILESTSPPGTCKNIIDPIIREETGFMPGNDYYLAHSPERVIPGDIVRELVENDRIVGGYDVESAEIVKELYQTFVKGEIFITDCTTAEFSKVAENTFRDVNIALANEFLKISEELEIDVHEMINLANQHPRVNILKPGPGVGGHCIAVDPWFLTEISEHAKLIKTAREINDSMPEYTYQRIKQILPEGKITVLGLTFKPNTDDFRGSPLIEIAKLIANDSNYDATFVDPYGDVEIEGIKITKDLLTSVMGSELLVLGVNHKEYMCLDFKMIGNLMKTRRFFDTRGVYDFKELLLEGFESHFLGNV